MAKSAAGESGMSVGQFFTGYRQTALPPDDVVASIRIPVSAKGEFPSTYKQAKRKDDDITIVTAALRVRLDNEGVVADCSLIYGGMAAMTVVAKTAMAYLVGKRFAELETLEGAMDVLGVDFDLRFSVPGGMASYRKALALGFFYRFYHDVLATLDGRCEHVDREAVDEVERSVSKSTVDEGSSVAYEKEATGKATPHVAALQQTTGEAQYTDDMPPMRNELYGCWVLSTKAHARIMSVDYSAALDMAGVVGYVDKDDMPSADANRFGTPHFDEVFFAEGEVHTAGQPIAMVLATSALRAQQAARAVRVAYEELPAVLTTEEAVEKESFHPFYREIKRGDVGKAFGRCDHVFTGTARMGVQEHFYLETQECVAVPKLEGEMEVFASTQNANETQVLVSRVCNVQANKVVVRVKRLGGGFGGKETRSIVLSVAVALAARKTGRPVRCMLTREENMVTSGQRHLFMARYKVDVNGDGRIQALDIDFFCNAGWIFDLSAGVLERAMTHLEGCYDIPNVHVRGRLCRTNTMSNTAFRGFGGPQGMFVVETYMEEVADRLGIAVERLREVNMYGPRGVTHFNQALSDWHVPLMWKQVQEEESYVARRAAAERFNAGSRWRKRGLALIPTKFDISFTALFLN